METGVSAMNSSTTSVANITAGADKHPYLYYIYFWTFGVLLCIISVIGVVTNAINIYALTLTARKSKRPMYYCLICMAAVDMLVRGASAGNRTRLEMNMLCRHM